MLHRRRGGQNRKTESEPSEVGRSSFAWDFVNDEHTDEPPPASTRTEGNATGRPARRDGERRLGESESHFQQKRDSAQASVGRQAPQLKHPTSTLLPSGGTFGSARANYIRDQLDRALDHWWTHGEMPPLLLLRDGLLLLEAGGSASESQRTLLLRAALSYDKGVQTALRHQVDAERIALVVAVALVDWEVPLAPERLPAILAGDVQVQALLAGELERSRIVQSGELRQRAEVALDLLPRPASKGRSPLPPPPSHPAPLASGRRPFRQLLLILLLVAVVGFVFWQQRLAIPPGMIAMPAATYSLLAVDGKAEPVRLEAYFIDRFEVTNRDYRTCIERGACKWPLRSNSATRADYFNNPAFDGYPVVNVTQAMAESYCAWQDRRLPTAGEWQAAASVSTTTGQPFRYPWGESFDPQRTNSASTAFDDTVVVGSFRPAGDSPSGASDMAGNVAEWTSTLVAGSEVPVRAIVKGGSFASDSEALIVGAEMVVEVDGGRPELGFRCARAHLLTES